MNVTPPTLRSSAADSVPEISIVIPILNEEGCVGELCSRLDKVMNSLGATYEIIFIDDVSRDETVNKLVTLRAANNSIRIIQLSRKFGYQPSIFAGLEHAQGKFVITMDGDLQHPPEMIEQMIATAKEGYDIVNMVRSNLEMKTAVAKIGSRLFYKLANILSSTPIVVQSSDFRLYTRRVVDILNSFTERTIFLRGLVGWLGFRQAYLPFKEEIRRDGKTKFSLSKMISLAMDGIISFSTIPLFIATFVGFAIVAVGIIYGIWVIINTLFVQNYPAGWPTIICLILVVGGANMMLVGIASMYIAKMFIEIKTRPRYIIDQKIGFENDGLPRGR